MNRRFPVAVAASVLLAGVAEAQPRRGGPGNVPPHVVMERLSRMSPKERDALLSKLPPERRSLLEDRLGKYSRMPSEAKERLRLEYNSFEKLPSDRQEEVRKLYKQFSELPDDRRRRLRRELIRLRNLPAGRRSSLMESEKFRGDYSDSERQLLTSLVESLTRHPPQPPPAQ